MFGGGGAGIQISPATVGSAPMPPADVAAAAPARSGTASLDGWLLNNLFGRR
jgi:hypothetical protein